MSNRLVGTGTFYKGQLAIQMFQTGFVVPGAGFFPIETINLLGGEEIRTLKTIFK